MSEKPAQGLCKLFGRTTEFNIIIYVTALIGIIITGSFWIYGMIQLNDEDRKKWVNRSYVSLIVGIIVVSFLWAANMIYYEVAFNKKCGAVERFIDKQIFNIRNRLDAKKLAQETSRVVADTLTDEFKKQLSGSFVTSLLSSLAK